MAKPWMIWMCAAALVGCPGPTDTETDTDPVPDTDTDPVVDPCTGVPGEVMWSWPDAGRGELAVSNPAAERITVFSESGGVTTFNLLDPATGQFVSARALLGDDAPVRPFADGDLVGVGTAAFVSRDAEGRTFVLDIPNSGDEASIPAMVYRYESDGTKAFATELQNAVHGSLQIEPDGLGGVIVAVMRMPAERLHFIRVAPDGTVAWELSPQAGEFLHGFALIDGVVRVIRTNVATVSILEVDLGTGQRGAAIDLVDPPTQYRPHRVAAAPDGDLYLLGNQSPGDTSVVRLATDGSIVWQTTTGTEGYSEEAWALDLASFGAGEGVCAGTPVPPGPADRLQALVCLDPDGALVGDMGSVFSDEGGIHLDAQGHLFTTDLAPHRVVVRFCSPFPS